MRCCAGCAGAGRAGCGTAGAGAAGTGAAGRGSGFASGGFTGSTLALLSMENFLEHAKQAHALEALAQVRLHLSSRIRAEIGCSPHPAWAVPEARSKAKKRHSTRKPCSRPHLPWLQALRHLIVSVQATEQVPQVLFARPAPLNRRQCSDKGFLARCYQELKERPLQQQQQPRKTNRSSHHSRAQRQHLTRDLKA